MTVNSPHGDEKSTHPTVLITVRGSSSKFDPNFQNAKNADPSLGDDIRDHLFFIDPNLPSGAMKAKEFFKEGVLLHSDITEICKIASTDNVSARDMIICFLNAGALTDEHVGYLVRDLDFTFRNEDQEALLLAYVEKVALSRDTVATMVSNIRVFRDPEINLITVLAEEKLLGPQAVEKLFEVATAVDVDLGEEFMETFGPTLTDFPPIDGVKYVVLELLAEKALLNKEQIAILEAMVDRSNEMHQQLAQLIDVANAGMSII